VTDPDDGDAPDSTPVDPDDEPEPPARRTPVAAVLEAIAVGDGVADRSRSRSSEGVDRPMRGFKRLRRAQTVCSGHAFVQNLRRDRYELGFDTMSDHRLEAIFSELALAI
jgi:hypothetical protein